MPKNDPALTEQERKDSIYCQRAICSDVENNSNKFWHGYVLSDGTYVAEYGRVGESPLTVRKQMGESAARSKVDSEIRKRLNYRAPKKPYVLQRTIADTAGVKSASSNTANKSELANIALSQIRVGSDELKKLVKWLAEVNVHTITSNTNIVYNVSSGIFSTPLGVVTQSAIDDARVLLGKIADEVAGKGDIESESFKNLCSQYCQVIPQDVGRKRGWHVAAFGSTGAVRRQNDILDSLDASIAKMTQTDSGVKQVEQRVFDVELSLVNDLSLFKRIQEKYNSDKGGHYDVSHYRVSKIYDVHISSVKNAFESKGKAVGNVMELWHGTKASNLLSILKQGLIIPPASSSHCTGRLLGNGLYFSSMSSKSLRYATNAWTHGGNTGRTFMFLSNVSLGKSYTARGNEIFPVPGYDSVFGKPGYTTVWGGTLQNPEYVVYNTCQCDLRYLVEFSG